MDHPADDLRAQVRPRHKFSTVQLHTRQTVGKEDNTIIVQITHADN